MQRATKREVSDKSALLLGKMRILKGAVRNERCAGGNEFGMRILYPAPSPAFAKYG
jgi:hypothetical protein